MESLCVPHEKQVCYSHYWRQSPPSFTLLDQPLALGGYWLQKFTNAVHWRVNIFGRSSQYFTIAVVTRITLRPHLCLQTWSPAGNFKWCGLIKMAFLSCAGIILSLCCVPTQGQQLIKPLLSPPPLPLLCCLQKENCYKRAASVHRRRCHK